MNYGEKIRIFLVFFLSTLFLLIGIFATIIISGLYFSPVSKDFSIETVNKYNNLLKDDMETISRVLNDEKIDKEEIKVLENINFDSNNIGKFKIISNTYRLTHQYSRGEIRHYVSIEKPLSKTIGNFTIKIVIFIKDNLVKNAYENCNDFSFLPFKDENLGSQYYCANKDISTLRVYSSNLKYDSFIISTVLPVKDSLNNTLGFIQIITDANVLEEKLGKFLISILSPLLICMMFVGLFILYLQNFLSKRIKINFINANNIAHNLKNKTNAIRYYSQKKFETTDEAKNSFIKILQILDNVDNFIETTLNTAKQSYHSYRSKSIKPQTEFSQIIQIIKDLYISHKIIYRGDYSYGVLAEKNKLIDALTAIIDNSLYWNAKHKPIIIETRKKINILEIRIMDHGPGLNQNDKNNIFNEGFSKSGGNGLGLYVAKNIIKSFDGEVIASNRDKEGLIMTVKLRLLEKV